MTQQVPATAVLGPGKTGLTIGVTVLNIDGTEYAAFATTGVAETSVAGTYRKAGGVVCPDAGGYIVWGVSGTDYAEATVESTSANVTEWKGSTAPAMTGDAYARLGAPAGASVSADVAAVKAQTAAIETDTQDLQTQVGTDGAGLTNLPWNAAWDAEVQSEAADAITAAALATAANLATLAGYVDTEVAAILAAVDTEVAAIKTKTDYLPSATAGAAGGVFIAGANAATSITTALTANITGDLSGSVGSVTGAVGSVTGAVGSVTGAVGSVTGNVGGNVVGSVGSVSGDTKQTADVAALITTVGVAGAGLTALATQASVNTIDDFLDTEIAAILADTNELQTDLVNGGRLDLLIDAIKAKTDNLPASPAATGAAMTLTSAYDAAKTAATQTSVDDIPTNAELAAALGTADDATLAAISGLNNLSSAQAQSAAAAALTAYDPPTNAEMVARTLLAADYTVVSDLGTVQTGDSYARLGAPAGASIAADIAGISAGTAPTVEDIDTRLSTTHGAGSWLSGGGSGTGSYTDTITDGANPLDGVRVQLSTDAAGTNRAMRRSRTRWGVFALSCLIRERTIAGWIWRATRSRRAWRLWSHDNYWYADYFDGAGGDG